MEIKTYKNGCPPEAMDIRTKVFVEEQGFQDEFDDVDAYALHIVAFDGDTPAGTARAFWDETAQSYHIGRVAVMPAYRQQHLGTLLMRACEDAIKKEGGKRVTLSSQLQARGFYESVGYTAFGDEYYDQHCPHIMMGKNI